LMRPTSAFHPAMVPQSTATNRPPG
jgi:hypothetical protein